MGVRCLQERRVGGGGGGGGGSVRIANANAIGQLYTDYPP